MANKKIRKYTIIIIVCAALSTLYLKGALNNIIFNGRQIINSFINRGSSNNTKNSKKIENINGVSYTIGKEVDSYKGVPVYYNGSDYGKSYGKSYSSDGYLFGQKWQCVEFIKRFYYKAKGHKMPEVYGNAKDFFDAQVLQGGLNKERGLVQYKNGGNVKPEPDDIIVFNDTKFGHVAIVTEVGGDYIEVIQQNVSITTRAKYKLANKNGRYYVGTNRVPAGWLRKK